MIRTENVAKNMDSIIKVTFDSLPSNRYYIQVNIHICTHPQKTWYWSYVRIEYHNAIVILRVVTKLSLDCL